MGMAARSTGLVQQRIALMRYAIKAIFEVLGIGSVISLTLNRDLPHENEMHMKLKTFVKTPSQLPTVPSLLGQHRLHRHGKLLLGNIREESRRKSDMIVFDFFHGVWTMPNVEHIHHYQRGRASITGLMLKLEKIIETDRLVVVG